MPAVCHRILGHFGGAYGLSSTCLQVEILKLVVLLNRLLLAFNNFFEFLHVATEVIG
jgi:hypothetical protein